MLTVNTTEQFIKAYKNGERHFIGCDLDECSFSSVNLSEAIFTKSFLPVDFDGANCENTHFLKSNLKGADFANANLRNAIIQECSVEGISLTGAIVEGIIFKDNFYMGSKMDQADLNGFL